MGSEQADFLASEDRWCRPVMVRTGSSVTRKTSSSGRIRLRISPSAQLGADSSEPSAGKVERYARSSGSVAVDSMGKLYRMTTLWMLSLKCAAITASSRLPTTTTSYT